MGEREGERERGRERRREGDVRRPTALDSERTTLTSSHFRISFSRHTNSCWNEIREYSTAVLKAGSSCYMSSTLLDEGLLLYP